ncbi:uncharacterized protein QC763_0110110 [Podospora pseudopauciseta]|uniref:Uncharacterized protein n=1 Tax=Podospora pseudopauciseta TaxID=2093780 RepID=A0ABR0H2K7_9PEZI|nr:hypothetical protein QC763_0110110 [Podospora pseudopauciseta]
MVHFELFMNEQCKKKKKKKKKKSLSSPGSLLFSLIIILSAGNQLQPFPTFGAPNRSTGKRRLTAAFCSLAAAHAIYFSKYSTAVSLGSSSSFLPPFITLLCE